MKSYGTKVLCIFRSPKAEDLKQYLVEKKLESSFTLVEEIEVLEWDEEDNEQKSRMGLVWCGKNGAELKRIKTILEGLEAEGKDIQVQQTPYMARPKFIKDS